MDDKSPVLSVETGGYSVFAQCRRMGRDFLVAVWGGEPHIGAVAMAQPRPKLQEPNKISATASVFCYVGHKDDEVAKIMAEKIAADLNTRVVVAAGMHWDNLTRCGLRQVLSNVEELTLQVIGELKNVSEDRMNR
ncbi:prenylated flavin chaperone LpdD [Desulforhopalus singaporensis]|uniref:Prenylated flavin chaperone LpdD-like domain-containing protein n=1 Tax=Desulforhopalus singaporensis TaxID=91360 RepID=A0A1H0KUD8_9BACT|nr:hypothetical protein [Desulforhopalus singaporensis]SDO59465.1 hypothetical protein SAMN05660330_00629 [Desulforhopalus singaporensis]